MSTRSFSRPTCHEAPERWAVRSIQSFRAKGRLSCEARATILKASPKGGEKEPMGNGRVLGDDIGTQG